MLLVWRGAGILVVIFAILGLIVAGFAARAALGADALDRYQKLWFGAGVVLAAVATWLVGNRLNRGLRGDDARGDLRVPDRPTHSLFGIAMEGWAALELLVGGATLLGGLISGWTL